MIKKEKLGQCIFSDTPSYHAQVFQDEMQQMI